MVNVKAAQPFREMMIYTELLLAQTRVTAEKKAINQAWDPRKDDDLNVSVMSKMSWFTNMDLQANLKAYAFAITFTPTIPTYHAKYTAPLLWVSFFACSEI